MSKKSASDGRLSPGSLLVVHPRSAKELAAQYLASVEDAEARRTPSTCLRGLYDLTALLRRPDREKAGPGQAGRPPLRGALFDLFPREGTIFEALSLFREHYGCTPAVLVTDAGVAQVAALCREHTVAFSRAEDLQSASHHEALPHWLLGVLWFRGRRTQVVARAAFARTELARSIEGELFGPSEARRADGRRFALEIHPGLEEHELRAIEALFDGIPEKALHVACDVAQRTMTQRRYVLGGRLGRPLAQLLSEYAIATGAISRRRDTWRPRAP